MQSQSQPSLSCGLVRKSLQGDEPKHMAGLPGRALRKRVIPRKIPRSQDHADTQDKDQESSPCLQSLRRRSTAPATSAPCSQGNDENKLCDSAMEPDAEDVSGRRFARLMTRLSQKGNGENKLCESAKEEPDAWEESGRQFAGLMARLSQKEARKVQENRGAQLMEEDSGLRFERLMGRLSQKAGNVPENQGAQLDNQNRFKTRRQRGRDSKHSTAVCGKSKFFAGSAMEADLKGMVVEQAPNSPQMQTPTSQWYESLNLLESASPKYMCSGLSRGFSLPAL